jgi:hypothetical protein
MLAEIFQGHRPPPSGVKDLEPLGVWSGTDVLLGQAHSLERLRG